MFINEMSLLDLSLRKYNVLGISHNNNEKNIKREHLYVTRESFELFLFEYKL